MRHALGLRGKAPSRSTADHPSTSTGGSQTPKRRFIRDGEVPVTFIRRDPDAAPGTNQLDTARQAIRSEAMARERAEQSLEEAQITIRDLQTKLAHERLASVEALETAQRAATAEQAVQQTLHSVQAELVAKELALRNTEDALAEAQDVRLEAEGKLREEIAAEHAGRPSRRGVGDATRTRRKVLAVLDPDAERHATRTTRTTIPARKKKKRTSRRWRTSPEGDLPPVRMWVAACGSFRSTDACVQIAERLFEIPYRRPRLCFKPIGPRRSTLMPSWRPGCSFRALEWPQRRASERSPRLHRHRGIRRTTW